MSWATTSSLKPAPEADGGSIWRTEPGLAPSVVASSVGSVGSVVAWERVVSSPVGSLEGPTNITSRLILFLPIASRRLVPDLVASQTEQGGSLGRGRETAAILLS
jgi:hypothetical protein